jgi:heme-degrading monooxygenase HmoA
MLMRITWGKIQDGRWDEYVALWQKSATETHGAKGLGGRWLLRDRDSKNAGYSISLWETNEALESYVANQQGRPVNTDMVACFTGQYVTTICDVCATDPAS